MAQPPHFDVEGVVYFVTTRLKDTHRLLTERQSEIVQKTILEAADKNEFILYAYVVMPSHIHILLKPMDEEISKIMQLVKGRASRLINQGNFWQKGFFDFAIYSDGKFIEKFNYIHHNPVKWGLVEKAEDYKYSSAGEYKTKHGECFY